MKIKFLALIALGCIVTNAFSQSTIAGNNRPGPGPFLGWNAGVGGALDIRNDIAGGFPINFYTAGTFRMTIRGQAGPTQGFVGINTNAPASRLTVLGNQSIGSNIAAPVNGLRVFGDSYFGGNGTPQGVVHIDNNTNVFQLVLESTNPNNPDMTFADNTGVKGQIRYTMGVAPTTFRGLAFGVDDANNTWFGVANTQIFINGVSQRIGLGINVYNPQNRVEITSSTGDPYFATGNASGLRFTNLTATSPTATPVTNNVLSVDNNGDVILIPSTFGAICGAPSPVDLAANSRLGLNTFNFYFDGNATGNTQQNNVIIGKNCSTPIFGKLDVLQNSGVTNGSVGIYVENRDLASLPPGTEVIGLKSFIPFASNPLSAGQIGVQAIVSGDKLNIAVDGLANSTSNLVSNYGGRFIATSSTASVNFGIDAKAEFGLTNAGIVTTANGGNSANGISATAANATGSNTAISGVAIGGTSSMGCNVNATGANLNQGFFTDINSTGNVNVGLATRVQGATTNNFAGRFTAPGVTGFNYGVFGSSPNNPGFNYAGFFAGDIGGTGNFLYVSDSTLKQGIDSISNALGIINQLQPKTFFFRTTQYPDLNLPIAKQYGLISQEVEVILPELVTNTSYPAMFDSLGNITSPPVNYKALNYNAFIAILMKGMQEQQDQIQNQNERIDSLITAMSVCCASSARTQNPNIHQKDVTLSNSESIVLNQNVPNPFAEQTTISYSLPESVQKAQLLFYDASGKLIKAVDLTTRGNGQINVFANDLSSGIYSYALVADGQIADTKRMVKTQ